MYSTSKGWKFVEVDDYEKGCLPETAFHMEVDVTFKGSTKAELLNDIMNFYGVDEEAIELNACEEIGRIDISALENGDGHNASDSEIELWKQGKCTLYSVIYTHKAYKLSEVEL
jgi:hypothetical protein